MSKDEIRMEAVLSLRPQLVGHLGLQGKAVDRVVVMPNTGYFGGGPDKNPVFVLQLADGTMSKPLVEVGAWASEGPASDFIAAGLLTEEEHQQILADERALAAQKEHVKELRKRRDVLQKKLAYTSRLALGEIRTLKAEYDTIEQELVALGFVFSEDFIKVPAAFAS